MHHSLRLLISATRLLVLKLRMAGLTSSMACKLLAVSARNLFEICTVTQLEYSWIIHSDNTVVIEQLVLVMFSYRDTWMLQHVSYITI